MKKITKILSTLLTIAIILGAIASGVVANAVTNPYGKWQTISGVTTVRCTYYAWQQAYDNTGVALPNFGNAKNWYSSAKNAGYSVGSTAKAKSIAVWTNSGYGHVGYVVSVNGSKMTVNEGGMTNTDGSAYNGDGIINGSTCNSTVGSNKSSYSSSVLVGFIYLTENSSDSVRLSMESNRNTITNTNAIIYGRVDKPSNYAVTKIGIKIRKEGSTYSEGWSKYEAPSQNYIGSSFMLPYYNMNEELKLKLNCKTKYYYKFFAIVNNVEYWSQESSFTTTGSHSFNSWSTTSNAKCESTGLQTRTCKTCSLTETKTIAKLGHNFSSNFTIDTPANCGNNGSKSKHCSRCSAKSSITTIPATSNHTYSNSSDSVCNECGKTRQLGAQLIKEGGVNYYYYNGVKSTSTGIFDYNGKKIYINKGRFLGSSGLVTISGKKMYINKGYFTGASGLVTINGKKMYINKGYFTGASGLVTLNGKKTYINKGYFTGASGLVTISGKKAYINKGYFTGATGIVKISGKKYYIKKGYAQTKFSGKVKISGKTYTVKKGIVK